MLCVFVCQQRAGRRLFSPCTVPSSVGVTSPADVSSGRLQDTINTVEDVTSSPTSNGSGGPHDTIDTVEVTSSPANDGYGGLLDTTDSTNFNSSAEHSKDGATVRSRRRSLRRGRCLFRSHHTQTSASDGSFLRSPPLSVTMADAMSIFDALPPASTMQRKAAPKRCRRRRTEDWSPAARDGRGEPDASRLSEASRECGDVTAGEASRECGDVTAGEASRECGDVTAGEASRECGDVTAGEASRECGDVTAGEASRECGDVTAGEASRECGDVTAGEASRECGDVTAGEASRECGDVTAGEASRECGDVTAGEASRECGDVTAGEASRECGDVTAGEASRECGDVTAGEASRECGDVNAGEASSGRQRGDSSLVEMSRQRQVDDSCLVEMSRQRHDDDTSLVEMFEEQEHCSVTENSINGEHVASTLAEASGHGHNLSLPFVASGAGIASRSNDTSCKSESIVESPDGDLSEKVGQFQTEFSVRRRSPSVSTQFVDMEFTQVSSAVLSAMCEAAERTLSLSPPCVAPLRHATSADARQESVKKNRAIVKEKSTLLSDRRGSNSSADEHPTSTSVGFVQHRNRLTQENVDKVLPDTEQVGALTRVTVAAGGDSNGDVSVKSQFAEGESQEYLPVKSRVKKTAGATANSDGVRRGIGESVDIERAVDVAVTRTGRVTVDSGPDCAQTPAEVIARHVDARTPPPEELPELSRTASQVKGCVTGTGANLAFDCKTSRAMVTPPTRDSVPKTPRVGDSTRIVRNAVVAPDTRPSSGRGGSGGGRPAGKFCYPSAVQITQVCPRRVFNLEARTVNSLYRPRSGETSGGDPGQGRLRDPSQRHLCDPGQGRLRDPGQGRLRDPGQGRSHDPGHGHLHDPGQGPLRDSGQGPVCNPGRGRLRDPSEGPPRDPGQGRLHGLGEGRLRDPDQNGGVLLRRGSGSSMRHGVVASEEDSRRLAAPSVTGRSPRHLTHLAHLSSIAHVSQFYQNSVRCGVKSEKYKSHKILNLEVSLPLL